MLPARRSSERPFKLFAAFVIVAFYLVFSTFIDPPKPVIRVTRVPRQNVQYRGWKGEKSQVDTARAGRVKDAMQFAFKAYKQKAWGSDDVRPVSGKAVNNRYGWSAFVAEASTTLALMGLWEEFSNCLEHLADPTKTAFSRPLGPVEPYEATSTYLGALVSLFEMGQADLVPASALSAEQGNLLVEAAAELAQRIEAAYQTKLGLPWPRVDFESGKPVADSAPSGPDAKVVVAPRQAGGVFLELAGLTRVTGDPSYQMLAVRSWSSLVFDKYAEPLKGLVSGPVDSQTGEPAGAMRHWDAGHHEYYDTLLKAAIWAPTDRLASEYKRRWLQAAYAVRRNLTSRSAPAQNYLRQHLHLGGWSGQWYVNEMSQAGCAASATLLLGGTYFNHSSLVPLGKAVLEACHHVYWSSPSKLGADRWSWQPVAVYANVSFRARSKRSLAESDRSGLWAVDPRFSFRPAYFAALFYAWRITGETRYRRWAWDAFLAIETHCKSNFGFAAIVDVSDDPKDGPLELSDEPHGLEVLQTFKWLWLTFADTDVLSLDDWVFTTGGHALTRTGS